MPISDLAISELPASAMLADPAWDEALLRVEGYLRAHRLESRGLRNRLAAGIVDEARGGESSQSGANPVARAMQVTHARIGRWFARARGATDWSSERDRAHGRLALVIADLPGRWSNYFLSSESVPPELVAAIAAFQFEPGPELRFSNMPPATLDFGLDGSDRPFGGLKAVWLLVRGASSWLLVVGLVSAAWAASH